MTEAGASPPFPTETVPSLGSRRPPAPGPRPAWLTTPPPRPRCDPPEPAVLGELYNSSPHTWTERPTPLAGRRPKPAEAQERRGPRPGLRRQPVALPASRPQSPSSALTRSGSAPPGVPVTLRPVRPRFSPATGPPQTLPPPGPGPALSPQAAILPRGPPGNPAESPRRGAAASSDGTRGGRGEAGRSRQREGWREGRCRRQCRGREPRTVPVPFRLPRDLGTPWGGGTGAGNRSGPFPPVPEPGNALRGVGTGAAAVRAGGREPLLPLPTCPVV